jgi:hypothetical protein
MIYSIDRDNPIGETGGERQHYIVGASVADAPKEQDPDLLPGFVAFVDGVRYSLDSFPYDRLSPETTKPYQALLPPLKESGIVVDPLPGGTILSVVRDGTCLKSFVYDSEPDHGEYYRLAGSFDIPADNIIRISEHDTSRQATCFWEADEYQSGIKRIRQLRLLVFAALVATIAIIPIKIQDAITTHSIKKKIEATEVEISNLDSRINILKRGLAKGGGISAMEITRTDSVIKALEALPPWPIKDFKGNRLEMELPHPGMAGFAKNVEIISPDTVSVALPN